MKSMTVWNLRVEWQRRPGRIGAPVAVRVVGFVEEHHRLLRGQRPLDLYPTHE